MLSDRHGIATLTQKELDKSRYKRKYVSTQSALAATTEWGVKVERIEMKDLRLPQLLTRVMAAEAEAARTARAQLIYSQGEQLVNVC